MPSMIWIGQRNVLTGRVLASPAQNKLHFKRKRRKIFMLAKSTFFYVAVCSDPSVSEAWYDAKEYFDGRWAVNVMIAQSLKCGSTVNV